MIKGNVEIIQSNGDSHIKLFEASNLTVDGVRETIADVITYMPNPSAYDAGVHGSSEMEVGASSVSGYQVQAMSLGSAKDYYEMRNSRFYLQPQSASGGPNTLNASTVNYTAFTPKTTDTFEIIDVYSGIGLNQWRYSNAVDANIISNPTLDVSLGAWSYYYAVDDDPAFPSITQSEVKFADGESRVTKFEVSRGQQRVTLTQQVPISPGGVYHLYTNGRAKQAYFDFRVARGRSGIILEYYDFNTNRFVPEREAGSATRKPIELENWWEINDFRFQIRGQEINEMFQENNEYFVQCVMPSLYYDDTTFAPWDQTYKNPYIDIISLELCDEKYQILRNPNFLEHETVCMNSDFTVAVDFQASEVRNLPGCIAAGLVKLPGWRQINPKATQSPDPSNPDEAEYGYVQPFVSRNNAATAFSGQNDGIILHSSSTDITKSGAASINCTFALDDQFRNNFAYPDRVSQVPSLIDAGRGQADNNSTLMMSFDTMVSGSYALASVGHLEISLTRSSDGFGYSFSADPITGISDQFAPDNIPKHILYPVKEAWTNIAFPVILPADANRNQYTLSIKASGRTSGGGGYANYAIRNFKFGPLAGWRTYVYDKSGVGTWSLSSISTRTTAKQTPNPSMRVPSGTLCSGLSFSSVAYNTLGSRSDIETALSSTVVASKNQLVQNFVGMEPTKVYRLAVKGSCTKNTIPTFQYQLKAKTQENKTLDGYNVLGSWIIDSNNYSGAPVPPSFNPYSNDGLLERRTYPSFRRALSSKWTYPTDWGILVGASGTSQASAIMEVRANSGDYTLSGRVFNQRHKGAYFNLSSAPARMFNWTTRQWDNFAGSPVPAYRSSTSGNYFLPLPAARGTGNFDTFEYSSTIPITSVQGLATNSDTTPDGIGLRGEFKLTAGIWGSNFSGEGVNGATLVSDIALRGPGLNPNVDIWKELYYNFTDQAWQVTPYWSADKTDASKGGDTPRSFISTPENLIANMCFSGLDRDTVYQVNIMDSSGGTYVIHDISLVDTSYVVNKGKHSRVRNANQWTSEPYADIKYDKYDGGLVIKQYSRNLVSDVSDPTNFPNGFRTCDSLGFYDSGFNPRTPWIKACNSRRNRSEPWLIRTLTLGDYDIKGGDTLACGWDAIKFNVDAEPYPKSFIGIEARYDDISYFYNFNTESWSQGSERREEEGTVRMISSPSQPYGPFSSMADVQQPTHIITPKFTAPNFGPETKIIFGLRVESNSADAGTNQDFGYKDFKLYKYTSAPTGDYRVSGDTYLYPEFPRPEDVSLQSRGVSGNPDELGHFLNRINYFSYTPVSDSTGGWSSIEPFNNPMSPSPTGEVDFEEAVTMGSYLPSAGLWFPSGTFGSKTPNGLLSGTLNQMGVVNSDGYIYRHPLQDRAGIVPNDASAGFLVSSTSSTIGGTDYEGYGNKTVRYVLKVHKDDWKFLDYYMGGIGAMGLHTLDKAKTYDKLGTNYQISGTGATYSTGDRVGLYNVSNPKKNPIFRLSNKKVTFPPGLKIDYSSTEHITIIWDINFVT